MRGIAHLITLAAMAATGAALATWVPVWWIGVLVALVLDGAWWTAARYEARIRDTGADAGLVTRLTWAMAGVSAALLITHAVAEWSIAWGAVALLPLISRTLAWVDALWEATAVSPDALRQIRAARQSARDEAAVARARLSAQAATERTRLEAVTAAGASVARVQAEMAQTLAGAWEALEVVRSGERTREALTCVTSGVTPASQGASHPASRGAVGQWELPVWGEYTPLPAIAQGEEEALSDDRLDDLVRQVRESETPPLSYREAARRIREAGHSASEVRLRAAWRRVTAQQTDTSA